MSERVCDVTVDDFECLFDDRVFVAARGLF